MTAYANSLTERDTENAAGNVSARTAPSSELRVLVTGLARLGYDTNSLLDAARLRDTDFDDPDARVSCEAYGTLIARAQQARFTPNLALELAQLTPMGAYPLLDYLVVTSDTVGAGVGQLANYFRLVGAPVTIRLDEDRDPIRVELSGAAAAFTVEYVASLSVLHLRNETEGRFAASGVSFQHLPDDVAGFERILRCPVTSGASWNGISVTPEAWHLPLRRRDPVLRQILESQAREILARLSARSGLALEVQRALATRVAGGDTRISALARELAMSARTLQRRLATEGVSYQELLEEARKEAAGRYLGESGLAIGEVGFLVGYSEPAPFHRAFKRWYGVTPQLFRQQHRHPDG